MRCHHVDGVAFADGAVDDAYECDDASVRIEVRVEDERAQWGIGVTARSGDVIDDGFKQIVNSDARLRRTEHGVIGRDGQTVFDLLFNALGLGCRKVDFVDEGNDLKVRVHRHHRVGDRLRFDALRCIDDENGALACGKAAGNLIGEIDMPRGVDEVQDIRHTIIGRVFDADRLAFYGNAALPLDIHGVEYLVLHVARGNRAGLLEDAVGQRRLAVVDVRDDRKIAYQALVMLYG